MPIPALHLYGTHSSRFAAPSNSRLRDRLTSLPEAGYGTMADVNAELDLAEPAGAFKLERCCARVAN